MKLKIKKMKLRVQRLINRDTYTLGELYVDDIKFCSTLEDLDRGLLDSMSEEEIKMRKVYGKTAVPKGTYKITLDVLSPKFSQYPFYMETCQGYLPRLIDVKGYEGVLIHVADGARRDELLQGCIGIGDLSAEEYLMNGKSTFKKLYDKLVEAKNRNEEIVIEII